jgi:8-oxo-dGTP pyrophosphatase MutT (NUDIX family)
MALPSTGIALMPVMSLTDLEAREKAQREEQNNQARPALQNLAAHVRKRWDTAKDARRDLEERMLQCLRQRQGKYDPDKLAQIKQEGGSEIFVNLTSTKCRGATSWLRDSLLGSGTDKPWSFESTPEPTLPPEVEQGLQQQMATQIMMFMEQTGGAPDDGALAKLAEQMKDAAARELKEEAETRVGRMEKRIEDQLAEGGWMAAFNEFIDDVVTFPFAALKGPVKRRRKVMAWTGGKLQPSEEIRNEWERVDPFMLYWAPWAANIQDGYVVERHKLTPEDLQALIGVPGYNEQAIRKILSENMQGKLNEWLWLDSAQAEAEGKDVTESVYNTDTIDALQLWDSVKGEDLLEWGVDEKDVPDPDLSYPCEVWLIGDVVIRAAINYDPLGRKPYFVTAYEKVPGSIAGKGVPDLCRDSQDMINAAARALANNMGISSGPQVGVNISRLPIGEDITQMYPWKIWQFTAPEYQDSTAPLSFFQPQSNVQELMAVFDRFSSRADEDTMLPKYMTGEHTPGVGRTSSGLSMLISNAGKGIKQVITNIDRDVIVPAIEKQYQDNLRYHADDPDIIGDVHIVARGASSLVVKEAEAIRRNEFMQIVLNSPVAQQIVGLNGTAELLREAASNLNGNVDRIVPDRQQISVIEQQQQVIVQLQQQLMALSGQGPGGGGGQPGQPGPRNLQADGSPQGGRESNYVSARPNGA